jgi:RimJ/RimL family protein N-acetyltransferase
MDNELKTSTGETFFFKKGITDTQIDQLIEYAQNDETVKNFTSDAKRFASRETFNAWRKPDAQFYTLTDEGDNLMGIIWFEELELPEFIPTNPSTTHHLPTTKFHTTFAIRTYGKARGKGLSVPFTLKALTDLRSKIQDSGIWLATSPDNLPAVTAYKHVGFIEIGMRKDGEKIIMILR